MCGVPGRHTSGCRAAKRGCFEQAPKTACLFTPAQRSPEGSGHGRSRRSEALRGHHVEESGRWRTLEHGRHLLPERPNLGH